MRYPTGSLSVIMPALPPESQTLDIPDSMHPEDKAFLVKELGKLSTEYARLNARDEERNKALDARFKRIEARIAKIEDRADKSGRHDIVKLEQALAAKDSDAKAVKARIISIAVTFFVTALIALVGFYLKSLGG